MKKATLTKDEKNRLVALRKLDIIDTQPEKQYDEIAELASYICETPIGLISILDNDKQWMKACVGVENCEAENNFTFCQYAIKHEGNLFEVNDARTDERFKNQSFTFGDDPVVFYAGVPLRNKEGLTLGSLCVIDHEARSLTEKQRKSLLYLANQVINLFEIRIKNNTLRESQKLLKEKNTQLKNFAGVVSHDMKMPLANMIVTIDIIKAKYSQHFDESGLNYINNLKQSAFKLSDYISNILTHYESDSITEENALEEFDLNELLEDIVEMLDINEDCEINLPKKNLQIESNRVALEQIFLNLIGNSIKYNDKEKIKIDIGCSFDDFYYHFYVKDNGIGIPENKQNEVFNLFTTITEADRKGNKGNGIGLSTVKKIIHNLGGHIELESKLGDYTKFKFQVERP